MRRISTRYEPHATVAFAAKDVAILALCSDSHYDFECRKLNQPGGTVFGLRNKITLAADGASLDAIELLEAQIELAPDDLQLLCKVLEGAPRDGCALYGELRDLLLALGTK